MIGGSTRHLGHNTVEPKFTKIDRIHKSIDHASGIILIDPVVQAFRKQRRLAAVCTFNKAAHQIALQTARESYHHTRFHTARVTSGNSKLRGYWRGTKFRGIAHGAGCGLLGDDSDGRWMRPVRPSGRAPQRRRYAGHAIRVVGVAFGDELFGDLPAERGERVLVPQLKCLSDKKTPGSGRTVMVIIGRGAGRLGAKRKRCTRVARIICACIIAKFAPTQTRGPAPNGRY